MKHLCVIGLGGVGGYFAYKLATTYTPDSGTQISFVARGKTFEAVTRNGLVLLSPETDGKPTHPALLGRSAAELPPADLYLVCSKEYDLEAICESIKPHVNANTVIFPLLNGVDISERIRRVIPEGIVLPSCVYISSHIRQKGVVEHHGGPGRIIYGDDPRHPGFGASALAGFFRAADIHITFSESVQTDIWTKFLFIASFGVVTARYLVPMGALLEEGELRRTVIAVMHEVEAVARAKGVALPEGIVGQILERQKAIPYDTPTSLMLDVKAGNPHNELDIFAGTVVRYGEGLGVPVPEMKRLYGEITQQPS